MRKITGFFLISLLFCELIYGFLFPSCGFNDSWQPITSYLPKFQEESADNLFLAKIYPLISKDYRLNSDIGHYLELARNFTPEYFNESPFLERPLYSFLIFFMSLPVRLFAVPSYGMVFALSILLNFILMSAGVLLFFSLLEKMFSSKVAWLSSVLLIFSPFVHSFINQPLAEMLMAFAVIVSAFMIYHYIQKPSRPKLVVFSLVIGSLMLGKMFFAISFFILILAFYHRRFKEGIIFLGVHLAPFLLWYLWVTQVWGLNYFSHQIRDWQMGVWVFKLFDGPWQETYRVLLSSIPDFATALAFSFLLIPIFFSLIGWRKMPFKSKNVIYFGAIFSVFALGFLAKFFYLRHVFLIFPIIYPTAALGIIEIANCFGKYRSFLKPVFYVMIITLLVIMSNINIYRIFDYNN
ncbi:MAG: hypothetical protein ABH841_02105 [Candidatus Nealsonbacteria bacterium]